MWYQVAAPTRVPAVVAFLPSWYYKRYGLSWGRRFYFDPDYRTEVVQEGERLVFGHFGHLSLGSESPEPRPIQADYGRAAVPAILGCEVEFPDDNYPWPRHLPESQIDSVRLPNDIESVHPVDEWVRQCRYLARKYDHPTRPVWNTQGVQNVALTLRGDELFVDYYENPERARRLLDVSAGAIERSHDYFRRVGSHAALLCHALCTVVMLSPEFYDKWLFPYDQRLHEYSDRNGYGYHLHHCGVIDAYSASYRRIPPIDMLEVGWESDIQAVMALFPEATVQYIVHVNFVRYGKPADIRDRLRAILDGVPDEGRFKVSIPDLDADVPDENVEAAVEALRP